MSRTKISCIVYRESLVDKFCTVSLFFNRFTLTSGEQRTITVTIEVPTGTVAGLLSKVILSATGETNNYFLFTTFVVSVIDDVIRVRILSLFAYIIRVRRVVTRTAVSVGWSPCFFFLSRGWKNFKGSIL